ncbi:Protein of unknown function [Amycolatopsis xylanica]|uniref:DUF998 domain-containing protein n=1 Tax=Amycolatopsis xylanica TaxID=589385 RepID=A0A1H3T299_9PSEU|nr:Protein of unknown function [Amycolatopsis xylanica]
MARPLGDPATRPWLITAYVAIGWGLFTITVLHLISSHDPLLDTLSSYINTDRGQGMLGASVLALSVGSMAVLGSLHAARIPLSRTTKILFLTWSLGLATAAVFPASYPESPRPISGQIHLYACMVAFLSVPAIGHTLRAVHPLAKRLTALCVGTLVLFAVSYFLTLFGFPDPLPVGIVQRLALISDVVLMFGLLRIASAESRAGLRRVAEEAGQPAGVQEDDRLVGLIGGGPFDQHRGRLAGVDGVQHHAFGPAEKP